MKKFLFFGVLFILLFQFTSCLDNDNKEPVYYFYDEPAVVDNLGEHPIVRNESYLFYVPGLAKDENLKAGNLLWTSFIVDLNNQETYPVNDGKRTYTATNFKYIPVDSAKVIIPANADAFKSYLEDDYSAPIELASLYRYKIDSLWFFGFKQESNSNQMAHVYELILNPDIEKGSGNYFTLYIRSKQLNGAPKENTRRETIFAFDMADFVKFCKEGISSSGPIRFNLRYKTGTDGNGKDIYREFMSNPISWDFNVKKPE